MEKVTVVHTSRLAFDDVHIQAEGEGIKVDIHQERDIAVGTEIFLMSKKEVKELQLKAKADAKATKAK